MKIKQNQVQTLSTKWDIASNIWHNTDEEKVILQTLINKVGLNSKTDNLIDVACGTGFHSIILKEMGFDISSCDIDPENLISLVEKTRGKKYNIPVVEADWIRINGTIFSKFSAIFCLGSSITYFESWNENSFINPKNRIISLKNILTNFKFLLKSSGPLIIGYSRYYTGESSVIDFPPKIIDGLTYNMKWKLYFDWNKKIKRWSCEVSNEIFEDYSFELKSHLYSLEEFSNICKDIYSDIEIIDVDEKYYDVFIICK